MPTTPTLGRQPANLDICLHEARFIWENTTREFRQGRFFDVQDHEFWETHHTSITALLNCFFYSRDNLILRRWDDAILVGSWDLMWNRGTVRNQNGELLPNGCAPDGGTPLCELSAAEISSVFRPPNFPDSNYAGIFPELYGGSYSLMPLEWVTVTNAPISVVYALLNGHPEYRELCWEGVFEVSLSLSEIRVYLLLYAVSLVLHYRHLNFQREIIRPDLFPTALPEENTAFPVLSSPFVHCKLIRPGTLGNRRVNSFCDEETTQRARMENDQDRTRTLTSLLRTCKKKWKSLTANPRAYTWQWISAALRTYTNNELKKWKERHRGMSENAYSRGLEEKTDQLNQRCLALLEHITKYPWISIKDNFSTGKAYFPRCMLKSCNTLQVVVESNGKRRISFSIIWLHKEVWNMRQASGAISWDKETCSWYDANCFLTAYVSMEPMLSKLLLITKANYQNFAFCDTCQGLFLNKDTSRVVYNQDEDKHECCLCAKKENPEATRSTVFGSYHSHHRNWNYKYYRTDKEDKKTICFGLEIEMHSKLGNTQNDAVETSWQINQKRKEMNLPNLCYFERDGSLLAGGLEMVTNPMSLAYHRHFWMKMLPKIREVAVGWNTQAFVNGGDDQWYGIHLTFHRRYMKDLALARLIKFFEDRENNNFILGLAQRRVIYSGETLAIKEKPYLVDKVNVHNGKIISGFNRYVPVNVKGDGLVELRFWRTTLNTESFFKNLEWFWAFTQWVKETPYSHQAKDFVKWVLSNKAIHGIIPNFIGYYSRRKFPVKQYGMLDNQYYTHFTEIREGQIPLFNLPSSAPKKAEVLNGDIECA